MTCIECDSDTLLRFLVPVCRTPEISLVVRGLVAGRLAPPRGDNLGMTYYARVTLLRNRSHYPRRFSAVFATVPAAAPGARRMSYIRMTDRAPPA